MDLSINDAYNETCKRKSNNKTQLKHSECQLKMKNVRLNHYYESIRENLKQDYLKAVRKVDDEKLNLIYDWSILKSNDNIDHVQLMVASLNHSKYDVSKKRKSNPLDITPVLSNARLILQKRDTEKFLENARHNQKKFYYNTVAYEVKTMNECQKNMLKFPILPFSVNTSNPKWEKNLMKLITTDSTLPKLQLTPQLSNYELYTVEDTNDPPIQLPKKIYYGPSHSFNRSKERRDLNRVEKIHDILNKVTTKEEIKFVKQEIKRIHLDY